MKKLFFTLLSVLLPYCLSAQTEKAKEVLDKVISTLTKDGGIQIDFEGTESGSIVMKGEKFYLHSGQIQSWYDGKTQWSYVADTEEVNISHPTHDELQGINPYLILIRYKTDFNYTYKGSQARNGVKGHEIILTPKRSEHSEIIRVFVSTAYQPLAMKVEQNGKVLSEINVTSYKTNQKLEDGMFKFNKSLFPNAEIIDMR